MRLSLFLLWAGCAHAAPLSAAADCHPVVVLDDDSDRSWPLERAPAEGDELALLSAHRTVVGVALAADLGGDRRVEAVGEVRGSCGTGGCAGVVLRFCEGYATARVEGTFDAWENHGVGDGRTRGWRDLRVRSVRTGAVRDVAWHR